MLIATDNDQEGHVIAADVVGLMEATGCRQPAYRLVLNGLTRDAMVKGLAQLTPVDIALANAGVARRIVDRLIGGGYLIFPRAGQLAEFRPPSSRSPRMDCLTA